MAPTTAPTLSELYLEDETAWLYATAELLRLGRHEALDFDNLREYITDMAKRDRKETTSRLLLLVMHVLKWEFQPEKRSGSWKATILNQAFELEDDAGSGVLRNHAEDVLPKVYQKAVLAAAAETGLPLTDFPPACPYTFDQLLAYVPANAE